MTNKRYENLSLTEAIIRLTHQDRLIKDLTREREIAEATIRGLEEEVAAWEERYPPRYIFREVAKEWIPADYDTVTVPLVRPPREDV